MGFATTFRCPAHHLALGRKSDARWFRVLFNQSGPWWPKSLWGGGGDGEWMGPGESASSVIGLKSYEARYTGKKVPAMTTLVTYLGQRALQLKPLSRPKPVGGMI